MKPILLLALCLLWVARVAANPVEDMYHAAERFLTALSPELREKAAFKWEDDERFNWHFIPKERNGVRFGALSSEQRHLAYSLLASGMSHKGYLKATSIMSLERILQDMEGPDRRFPRDPDLYHVSIFGIPSITGTWGWRVEGHHLSINFTIVEGKFVSGTPSFFGTNPAEVRSGTRKGLRVLAAEEDLARELVHALDDGQRRQALIATTAPDDILTGASREASIGDRRGVPLRNMRPEQKAMAKKLTHEYVGRIRGEFAEADLAAIEKAGWDEVYFAWAGSIQKGEKHYYRLHGPTFLVEYDNTQNDGNHVHAVWRDFANDFGRDLLREHYRDSHSK
jgi:hypothetical protein